MVQAFRQFVRQHNLFQKEHPILIAVSGGVDSMTLCDLFDQTGHPFGIAHCNFQLRGKEADRDESFVRQAAKQYDVPIWTQRFTTQQQAEQSNRSIQMMAREQRYKWLEEVRHQEGYHFIATAHHKNDVVETLLLNLIRGTGIRGLHGILPKQELSFDEVTAKVIRPLLFATKQEIQNYAEQYNINHREDQTNQETQYERNHIRHNVIPALQEINPRLTETIWENTHRFREAEALYRHAVYHFKKRVVHQQGDETFIDYHKLRLYPGPFTLLFEILHPYGFSEPQLEQVYDALDRQPGQQFYSDTHRLVKDREYLVLSARDSQRLTNIFIPDGKKKITLDHLRLRFQRVTSPHFKIPNARHIACVDYDQLTFPLQLRTWCEGDYFYPLGMGGKKKKLQDFFTDQKLSLIEKENTWLLLSGKKVVWVVGYRLDERFRVTDQTERILKVKQLPDKSA